MEKEKNHLSPLGEEVMKLLVEFFDESKHFELNEEELSKLLPEQQARYSRCHPTYCPNYGVPQPHYPHVPLYPTDWC